ncbi:MAG: ABC transporter substrate-binding protein [Pseudomonadota bacterium]
MVIRKLTMALVIALSFSLFFDFQIVRQSQAGEAPDFAQMVANGKLPPLEERLPENPLVVDFDAEGKTIGKYGGELRMLMGRAKDIGQITVYEYARLIGYDINIELVPDILESVDSVDDKEFTFKIRKGHRWSDGHLLTTEDFRYYWEDVIKDPELGRQGVPSAMLVEGEEPVFEIIDDLTFKYSWTKPNKSFLQALAGPSPVWIYLPAHYVKQFHAKYADPEKLAAMVKEANVDSWAALHTRKTRQRRPENPDMPTLQPWQNTTPPPAERFVFVRNPFFHRVDSEGNQLPYIDKLHVDIVSKDVIAAKTGSGESNLQARYIRFDNFTFLKESEEKHGFITNLWTTGKGSEYALYPNLNTKDPVWRGLMRDANFRRALSLAIDRDEINEVIYFGLASPSANTVLPQSPLFREEYREAWSYFDPDKANELLDAAGLGARDDDGVRLLPNGERAELTIESAGESTEETDVLELVAAQWKAIGIKAFVRASQRDIFRRRAAAGETPISVFFGLNNGVAAPTMSPEELAPVSPAQLQWPSWGEYYETGGKAGEPPDMPEAVELLDLFKEWKTSADVEEQTVVWHKMLDIFTDQAFSIGIVNNTRQPVVTSSNLRNVPEEGIYSWEPTSYFGIYRPDTFWFEE